MKTVKRFKQLTQIAWLGAVFGWLVVPLHAVMGLCLVYVFLAMGMITELKYK